MTVPIDVHLMVKPVDRIIPDFAAAGATFISFHPEATEHIDRTIGLIHEHGCKAGMVFNPATPLDYLDYTLEKLDMVLLMSVNPGFGGQKFIPSALHKLAEARKRIDAIERPVRLEIDGGVKVENIREIARAGADTFVAGSAVFGSKDYAKTIRQMHDEIEAARRFDRRGTGRAGVGVNPPLFVNPRHPHHRRRHHPRHRPCPYGRWTSPRLQWRAWPGR